MTMAQGPGHLAGIPGVLVVRAQQDVGFAVRLLHRDTRDEALREAGVSMTDEQLSGLHSSLDEIARMSFQDALAEFREEGVAFLT